MRYAETDQMGVVYHANYLIWVRGRPVELMRALALNTSAWKSRDDCHIVVATSAAATTFRTL